MKHSIEETVEIAAWTLLGVIAVFAMAAHGVGREAGTQLLFSPGGMVLYILIALLVGAVLTVWVVRSWEKLPGAVRRVLVAAGFLGVFVIWGRVMARGAYGVFSQSSPSLLVTVLFGALFFAVVMMFRAQVLWGLTTRVNTVLMLFALGVVAVMVAEVLTPLWVIILLLLVSIYDFIAVRKLETMQEMALAMAKSGFIPAIVIPKRGARGKDGRKQMALLGGGDVFVISTAGLVMTRAYGIGGLIVTACMLGAVVWLLCGAKPKKFYPAVPYIFAGLLIGMAGLWFFKLM